MKVVLDAYPVDTIRDIHEGMIPNTGPWEDVHATVAGQDLTLNDMEHGILRPLWRDKRIHYAVNCAAYGCPHLLAMAFTAANTETLLKIGARDYVNNARGVDVVDAAVTRNGSLSPSRYRSISSIDHVGLISTR